MDSNHHHRNLSFQKKRMPKLNFRFKHERGERYWETSSEIWHIARYELECHFFPNGDSYLEGINALTGEKFIELTVMTSSQPFILIRKPLPRYLKPYVPMEIRKERTSKQLHNEAKKWVIYNKNPTNDEELKLYTLMRMEELIANPKFHKVPRAARIHTSEYNGQLPAWYKCNHCGANDHDIHDCLTPQSIFVPINQRSNASGIPRSFLRKATDEEARTTAMVLPDGSFVMRKRETENPHF
jgi:hypothetical protein